MTAPKPQPGIMDISLYVGGQSALPGRENVVKLSSNENPFGASDKAIAAFQSASHQLHRYPNTDHADLRAAIGDVHGLDPDQIICGVGSDEILHLLCQAYAGPGDEVLHTEHGFAIYKITANAAGATPVEAKERERVTDVDALLDAATQNTKICFIANPNNPTGTMIGGNDIARLADGLPKGCLLVLDGAYVEFAEGYDGGQALISGRDNVFMTRTFSKLYGLGGLRIGWGYGPREIIDVLNRIRGPFNLSQAQLAAAEAAIRDREFAARCVAENTRMRAWLANALAELGVPSDTSCGNFILARLSNEAEASACDAWLKNDGIIVRQVGSYKLPHCLRITVGDEASCRRVVASVRSFKEQAQ